MQTIMITGCSSGFGLETARYFSSKAGRLLPRCALRRKVDTRQRPPAAVRLDVTSAQSIAEAIAEAGERLMRWLPTPGVGMLNALEGAPREAIITCLPQTLGTVATDPGG